MKSPSCRCTDENIFLVCRVDLSAVESDEYGWWWRWTTFKTQPSIRRRIRMSPLAYTYLDEKNQARMSVEIDVFSLSSLLVCGSSSIVRTLLDSTRRWYTHPNDYNQLMGRCHRWCLCEHETRALLSFYLARISRCNCQSNVDVSETQRGDLMIQSFQWRTPPFHTSDFSMVEKRK
jgi:hypothetical protein